jgi:hypothetical protein
MAALAISVDEICERDDTESWSSAERRTMELSVGWPKSVG